MKKPRYNEWNTIDFNIKKITREKTKMFERLKSQNTWN